MATIVERMLRENLSTNADYKTIQLLKSDKLAVAATSVLISRRRSVKSATLAAAGIMILVCMSYLVIMFSLITGRGQDGSHNSVAMLAFMFVYLAFPFVQVIAITVLRASLMRLEMLLILWFQETPGSQDQDRKALEDLMTAKTLGVF